MRINFWLQTPKKREHVGDLRLGEIHFKIGPREMRCEGVDWIQLAQERVHWRALVEHGNEACNSMQLYLTS
jgi:hypothetical protein